MTTEELFRVRDNPDGVTKEELIEFCEWYENQNKRYAASDILYPGIERMKARRWAEQIWQYCFTAVLARCARELGMNQRAFRMESHMDQLYKAMDTRIQW